MTSPTTKVSRAFVRDFVQLANHFRWDGADVEEMKQCVREDKGMRQFLEVLAKAQRDGYRQTRENGYMRLSTWLRKKENHADT